MKVKEILGKKSATVITITADQTLLQASQLLTQHNIGALVVVDVDNSPIGILSERDIVRQLAAHHANAIHHVVGDVMTRDMIIGFPEDDLHYVITNMTNKRFRHLPIMEDHKLVGMVSIGDVVKNQLDELELETHSLKQYIIGGYA